MRKHARSDANQQEIMDYARSKGASVVDVHSLGHGMVDIIIGYKGKNLMAEVKDGNKPPSKRRLTKDEQKFHDEWQGQICIIESKEDVDRIFDDIDLGKII